MSFLSGEMSRYHVLDIVGYDLLYETLQIETPFYRAAWT